MSRRTEENTAVRCSVIVPVHDMADTIGLALEEIVRQATPRDEIIVVDDGSTDRSAEVAACFPVRLIRHPGNRGPSAARNTAVRQAKGRLLFFTDADAVLLPGTIDRACRAVESGEAVDAVVGVYAEPDRRENLVSRFKTLWIRHSYLDGPRRIDWLFGCLFATRRSTYLRAGGMRNRWRRRSGGGDIEMGLRMIEQGCRIILVPELQVRHLRRFTLAELIRNDFRRGGGYLAIGRSRRGWAGLFRMRRFANIRASYLLGIATLSLAGLMAALSATLPHLLPWTALPLAVYAAANRRFYRALARHGSVPMVAAGASLLALSQGASTCGVACAILRGMMRRPRRRNVAAPTARSDQFAKSSARGNKIEDPADTRR